MAGTASPARRWLLLEHPGPWALTVLETAGVRAARAALQAAVVAGSGRLLLVRRPGRQPRRRHHAWMLVDHEKGLVGSGTWRLGADVDAPDAGLLAAASALASADDAVVTPETGGPLLLVCAHGRHDVCCALRGRPVAAALAERWPEDTWECSHVGGDRFAANLVVVPDGVYYGRLDADDAVAVVESHRAGRVDAQHLRGFTTAPPAAQAVLIRAHEQWGPADPRAFSVTSVTPVADERWHVELSGSAGLPERVSAEVTRRLLPPARLTCRATREALPGSFEVGDLQSISRARPCTG